MADHPGGPRRVALAWAGAYLLVSLAWLIATDPAVERVAGGDPLAGTLQSLMGLAFVTLSSWLVYLAVLTPLRRLAGAEVRWRHLMDSLDDVVWLTDALGGRMLFVNRAAERVYGRRVDEFLADADLRFELVHPDDRLQVETAALQLLAGAPRDIEYRIVRADGSVRWLRDRASMVLDARGEPIGLSGIAEDITEARAAARLEHEQRLRLEDVVETAMDAIITVDRAQTIRLFNRAASETFGLPVDAALGQPLSRLIPLRHRAAHQSLVEQFGEHGSTRRRMGQLRTLTGLRANGEEFPIEASISRTGSGEAMLMTVVLRDVSELRQAEEARRARDFAEDASRAKTDFLSRMSHEIRTPLNAVLGFSQLLEGDDGEPLSARQKARAAQIRSAGWHLLALINDVLDLSRVEAGGLAIQSGVVELGVEIDEVLSMCEEQARQARVRLHADYRSELPCHVDADPLRLRQVLINLLSNAIKYNRPGGQVHLRLRREAPRVVLEVEDNGLGMSAEQLAHLFEPFNRLGREHGGVEGTGIGLVLARQLVELMKGALAIRSEAGRGTVASVTLPLRDTGAEPAPVSVPADLAAAVADGDAEPAGLVLYVEDNPVNVMLVEQLLTQWPLVRFIHAEDGRSGIELIRRVKPDLILLDMGLPDMDGPALLEALHKDPRTGDLLVVALSASAMPEDIARARAAGACEYWTKPLDFEQFAAGMTRLLARRPPAREEPGAP